MAFIFENNELVISGSSGSVKVGDLAARARGPFYAYDLDDVLLRLGWLQGAFAGRKISINYALKANANSIILSALAKAGAGADVVSGGELRLALSAGMRPEQIVFSGVGKSADEIHLALDEDIHQIHVESLPELLRIIKIAKEKSVQARVSLRINPHISVKTHPYISTGLKENKFGIGREELPEVLQLLQSEKSFVQLLGLAFHLGSQIFDLDPSAQAIIDIKKLFIDLQSQGFSLRSLDIGGGLGVDYANADLPIDKKHFESYAETVQAALGDLDCELHCEPGRALVARSGVLLGRVQYVKETAHKRFIILDTGMNHLLRPALYQAQHRVVSVVQNASSIKKSFDIVGPICESADQIASAVQLAEPVQDDWLAIMDVGAYGFVMASTYNARPLPAEVVVKNGKILTAREVND